MIFVRPIEDYIGDFLDTMHVINRIVIIIIFMITILLLLLLFLLLLLLY